MERVLLGRGYPGGKGGGIHREEGQLDKVSGGLSPVSRTERSVPNWGGGDLLDMAWGKEFPEESSREVTELSKEGRSV